MEMKTRRGRIKFNNYGSHIKSLGYIDGRGNEVTVGVMLPRTIYKGRTTKAETIRVTDEYGILLINEDTIGFGESVTVPANFDIRVEVVGDFAVSYHCTYINPPRKQKKAEES